MQDDTTIRFEKREGAAQTALEGILRDGARRLLQEAIEDEVNAYIRGRVEDRMEDGTRRFVRNGYKPERELVTGIGPLAVRQPRARDKAGQERFSSAILPAFMRRTPSVDTVIPVLYLKGVATGDFSEALSALLGPNATGLSAANIVRLKQGWQEDYTKWSTRNLSEKVYVYWWADGIHFNVRLTPERPCMLVLMGALKDGTKELVAIDDGHRESKESWQALLRDVKARGLRRGPRLAVGDGALGFWAALEEEYPDTDEQRCWVHKTANMLDKLPKSVQPHAKRLIHDMYLAPSKAEAVKAYERFVREYGPKYAKTVECLAKDRDVLFTFYNYPAEHWSHIRTTNPIESSFATVRHRTRQTKGCGSRLATLTMVFKLSMEAEKHWRKLNGSQLIVQVMEGKAFVDGVLQEAA